MKIAITAEQNRLDGRVDQRFGRARYFAIVDTESGETTFVDNAQNLEAAQGAGVQAAQNVAAQGVKYVLTGHCGPKAFRTLEAAGILVVVGVAGSIAEAVERFKKGEFASAPAADVDSHYAV